MAKKNPTNISELIPDDKNFNKGNPYGNSLIEKSFRKFGAGRSILIDKNNRIIAGNKSVENAGSIGIEDVQVVESDGKRIIAVKRMDIDLDTPEGREMALADNQTAAKNIILDAEVIEAELEEAVCVEWGVEQEEKVIEAIEDEFNGTTPKITITVLGDLYELGMHRVLCGDSTNSDCVAKVMSNKKAELLLTDPPYGVSYAEKNKSLNAIGRGNRIQTEILNDHLSIKDSYDLWLNTFTILLPFLSDKSSYYCFSCQGGDQMMMMMALNESGYQVKHELIWVKNNHVLGRSDYCYKHEPIIYGWLKNGTHEFYGGFKTSIFNIDKPIKSDIHPTMKPIELMAELINNSSKINETVIDPYLGSGSTLIACEQLNRVCHGLELDEKYVDVIVARYIKYKKGKGESVTIKRNGTILTENAINQFIDSTNA